MAVIGIYYDEKFVISKATPEELATLSTDADWTVRHAVAAHPRTPRAALESLVNDVELAVIDGLAHNPNASDLLPTMAYGDRRIIVATSRYASSGLLEELAVDEDRWVRHEVARNPNCPPLVKMWLESGRYGGMTLKEFLESARGAHD